MFDARGGFVQVGQAFGEPIGFSTPAGDIHLGADRGNVLFATSAAINLSNHFSNDTPAGSFVVRSPGGRFDFDGQLDSSGGAGAGRFSVVAGSLGQNGFSNLAGKLSNSRFERIDIRQNSGDLLIGSSDSLSADDLIIEASSGSIDVEGSLSVSTAGNGGALHLNAGDRIVLGTNSSLLATGAKGKGGRIHLEAWDRDADGRSGLRIASGSTIDLSGSRGGGELRISVPRIDSVAIADRLIAVGQNRTTVEGVRVYNDTAIDAADIIEWREDASAFMTQAQGVLGAGIELVPGIVTNGASFSWLGHGLGLQW